MKEFFVTCRETCPECKGKGRIQDPTGLWSKFNKFEKELKEKTGATPSDFLDQCEGRLFDWWAEHGYDSRHWGNLAPEEIECDDCQAGIYVHLVPLKEALKELKNGELA